MILASAAIACLGLGSPVFAQAPGAEADFQRYIANHPELQRDPSLMNNPSYLRAHPAFAQFLVDHPEVRQQALGMGAYDHHHHWRDADWWHRHDPGWVTQNHPEWYHAHPGWGREHPVAEENEEHEEHEEHHSNGAVPYNAHPEAEPYHGQPVPYNHPPNAPYNHPPTAPYNHPPGAPNQHND